MAKQKKIAPEQKQKISDEAYKNGLEKTADKYGVHFSTIYYWRKHGQVIDTKQNGKPKTSSGLVVERGIPVAGLFARSPELTYKDEFMKILSLKIGDCVKFNTKEKANIVNACRSALQKKDQTLNYVMKKINETESRLWRIEPVKKKKTQNQELI